MCVCICVCVRVCAHIESLKTTTPKPDYDRLKTNKECEIFQPFW